MLAKKRRMILISALVAAILLGAGLFVPLPMLAADGPQVA
jgi:hypothetical protein